MHGANIDSYQGFPQSEFAGVLNGYRHALRFVVLSLMWWRYSDLNDISEKRLVAESSVVSCIGVNFSNICPCSRFWCIYKHCNTDGGAVPYGNASKLIRTFFYLKMISQFLRSSMILEFKWLMSVTKNMYIMTNSYYKIMNNFVIPYILWVNVVGVNFG